MASLCSQHITARKRSLQVWHKRFKTFRTRYVGGRILNKLFIQYIYKQEITLIERSRENMTNKLWTYLQAPVQINIQSKKLTIETNSNWTPTPAVGGVLLPAPHLLTTCTREGRSGRDPCAVAEEPWIALSLSLFTLSNMHGMNMNMNTICANVFPTIFLMVRMRCLMCR